VQPTCRPHRKESGLRAVGEGSFRVGEIGRLADRTGNSPTRVVAHIGTFAPDGPERCSGPPVVRYEPETLAVELGASFRLLESEREKHVTSGGKVQSFQFCRFERRV